MDHQHGTENSGIRLATADRVFSSLLIFNFYSFQVWLDYKLKLKKKIATNKKGITGTGGGRYTQISLSPLEQAVDSLLGLQHAVDPRGICFGGSGSVVEDVGDNEDILQTMDSTTTPTTVPDTPLQSRGREMPTTLRQRNTRQQDKTDSREEERVQLLKQHNTNQMDMLSTLTSIKENLSELARYNRKLYDLQKEKLVLLKAKEKRKEKENFDANRRHKEKLEVNLRMVKMKEAKYFK